MKTQKTAKHKFRKGAKVRAIENLGLGPYARLSRRTFTVVDRREGYYSNDFCTGRRWVLPRVSVKCGLTTFYSVAVRVKSGVEYVDLRDIDTRVVAKIN